MRMRPREITVRTQILECGDGKWGSHGKKKKEIKTEKLVLSRKVKCQAMTDSVLLVYIKAETRTDLCLLRFVAVLFIVAMCTINTCVHQ